MNPIISLPGFLTTITRHCLEAGIDLNEYTIDHLCRRSAIQEGFEEHQAHSGT